MIIRDRQRVGMIYGLKNIEQMMIKVMVLALLVMLTVFIVFRKFPDIKRRLRDRRLEADYFRRIRR